MILPCLAEEVGEAFINIKNIEDVNVIDTSGYGLQDNTIVTLEGGKQVTLNLPSDGVYNDMHMAAQIVIHENLTRDVWLSSNFPRLGISSSNAVMAQARKSNESVTAIPHQSNLRKTFDEKSLIMLTTGGDTTLSLYQNSDTTPVNNSSVTIMDGTFNKVQFGDFTSFGVIGYQMFSIGKAMTADDYMNLNILTKSLVGNF